MFRHVLTAAAIVACATPYVFAAERATFILTDGERKSGTVVFHGSSHENLINNYLNLGTDDGKEFTVPLQQVAVIDFVGGQPAAAELAALPGDSNTHLLVLRGGTPQLGHLVNLIGGDTLRWRNQAGQDQQYAIRDVMRIYLNPESARSAFGGGGGGGTVATTGQANPVTVNVDARQNWTDTGVTVTRGQHVSFRATGEIQFAPGNTAGPNGNGAFRRGAEYPVSSVPVGALIGRIDNGAAFGIGTQSQPLPMPASGRLFLGVNDTIVSDNTGSFSVVVTPSEAGTGYPSGYPTPYAPTG